MRPYVFLFLAAYLTIGSLHWGFKRTLIFTVIAYLIAFLAEYSSTRNGFPFGYYTYLDATRDRELWISNVPFMDSLSFTFLSYVSYTFALALWSRLTGESWKRRIEDSAEIKYSWRVILTGAVLFMLLDVIIDPVAFLGDRWFLGKIYTYKEEGEYFNIPLTNFGGWFLVGTAILYVNLRTAAWLDKNENFRDWGMRDFPGRALLGPIVYFSVLAFNLAVTFYIGEIRMGLCGLGISLGIFGLLVYKLKHPGTENE